MKYIKLILITLLFSNYQGQSNELLISKRLISDWSKYPIYPRLVEDENGEKEWKKAYKYLDSIDVYGITYLSDGLKINGFDKYLKITTLYQTWNITGDKKENGWDYWMGVIFVAVKHSLRHHTQNRWQGLRFISPRKVHTNPNCI